MAEDIVIVVNGIGNKEGMLDGIQFHNIHHELMLSDLYVNEFGHDDNGYATDNDWNNKDRPEQDVRLIVNTNIDLDELEDINDLGDEDELHLSNGLTDNKGITDIENQHGHFGPNQHKNQHNHFGLNQNDLQENPIVEVHDEDSDEDDDGDNNHLVPDNFSSSGSGSHSEGNNNTNTGNDDYQTDNDKFDDKSDTPNIAPHLSSMVQALQSSLGPAWDLDDESSYRSNL